MSRRLAPTAFRMPISRGRSTTAASSTFMMPMPPTAGSRPHARGLEQAGGVDADHEGTTGSGEGMVSNAGGMRKWANGERHGLGKQELPRPFHIPSFPHAPSSRIRPDHLDVGVAVARIA